MELILTLGNLGFTIFHFYKNLRGGLLLIIWKFQLKLNWGVKLFYVLHFTHISKERITMQQKRGGAQTCRLLTQSSIRKVIIHIVISQRVEKHTAQLHNHRKERTEARAQSLDPESRRWESLIDFLLNKSCLSLFRDLMTSFHTGQEETRAQ